jgi:two-component system, cell cycle response regulator
VGRFGGEEFLVVAPGCDSSPSRAQAERLREIVSSQPVKVKDLSIDVTVSVGVATVRDPTPQDLEALLSVADKALYLAKERGRNRVEGECSAPLPSAMTGPPDSSDPA